MRQRPCSDIDAGESVVRTFLRLIFVSGFLLMIPAVLFAAQTPEGTLKIKSRMVAQGIGLSWGEGVLVYKGHEYPFTYQANGLFRDVDTAMTAGELSGQVFNLKTPADLSGNYQRVEADSSKGGAGTSATMKNKNGVVVNLVSEVAGRKFNLSREGLNIELKTSK